MNRTKSLWFFMYCCHDDVCVRLCVYVSVQCFVNVEEVNERQTTGRRLVRRSFRKRSMIAALFSFSQLSRLMSSTTQAHTYTLGVPLSSPLAY